MHYVIGDVHGCYDEMMALLEKIEQMDEDAQIIFVGDFVDRGPKVDKVLNWCMEHITPDGKYQAVRGNHEQMILEWYMEWLEWLIEKEVSGNWKHMPKTHYDFSQWADKMNILTPEKLSRYIDFFESLPYDKMVEIESKWGKKAIFRIVHSYYEYEEVSEEEQHYSNLWKRNYYGNHVSDEILIHGHTPTIHLEYIFTSVKNTKPGMISYRKNDINVDGGCVYASAHPMYPSMLCAIRLEDLEEIYPYTVEERFMQLAEAIDIHGSSVEEEYQRQRMEKYKNEYLREEGNYRKQMLEKLGKF